MTLLYLLQQALFSEECPALVIQEIANAATESHEKATPTGMTAASQSIAIVFGDGGIEHSPYIGLDGLGTPRLEPKRITDVGTSKNSYIIQLLCVILHRHTVDSPITRC
ncbi:hypothetical protein GALMADRAFT_227271 [Galerina marginata CBS 339.88]|uniref:Uncharacterized protein n=1 Tax=Galerina marginata (strain CBS 339.88) TaxID=685588 RepID=A0A067T7J1_GALM3|nr:hypothetical protein GALMADRAFT_227271 [Galerina marginata CBS 339.88]